MVAAGHRVVCYGRSDPRIAGAASVISNGFEQSDLSEMLQGVDAVVSCIASRSGVPKDAWAIDHEAQQQILAAAVGANVGHFILLSAICVQKPELAFQQAKLAFEAALKAAPIRYSIVRPTAFFKSLSGQLDRVRAGKPFLVFGNGELTACKPISDADLGRYIAGCLIDPARWNAELPIGGPGPAITPLAQGGMLFEALGQEPKYRYVPVGLIKTIARVLAFGGMFSARLAEKAALARIGLYYATQSMLVWDAQAGAYDADATPEFGEDRLSDFYRRLAEGEADIERGAHKVF
jgi:divinyl chlorophyllide a 8-vinyl-reductase